MLQRIAALPLALSALFLFACDDGGEDGTDGSTGDVATTTDPGTATADSTTTDDDSSTTTDDDSTTTTDDDSTAGTGEDESSTGLEDSSSSGEGSSSTGEATIGYADLYGEYTDGFGTQVLTAESWTLEYPRTPIGTQAVEVVDDEMRFIAGFFDGDESIWLPGYSRFEWDFDSDGVLRYCQVGSGSETLKDALAVRSPDREDFDGVGCGGFAWSALTPVR